MDVLDDCGNRRHYSHGVKDSIEASLRSLEDRMCGLELESFLPQKDRNDEKQM